VPGDKLSEIPTPLNEIEQWAQKLEAFVFPVFSETLEGLHQLSDEDTNRSVDRFCENLLYDPGGVIAILNKANRARKGRLGTNVSTVENAAMMIGLNTMRQLTDEHPLIEPPGTTDSEKGYMRIVARAFHVAYQAYDWAIIRGDMTPKEIFVAAFLRDIGAMALWLHAPDKMKEIHQLKWEQMVSDDEAQYVILGFGQEQLGKRLAEVWRLPEMVNECLLSEDTLNPRVMTVRLANQMVHLSETSWYSDEMIECQESIAELLDRSFDEVVKITHKNALNVARETGFYGVSPSAMLLLMEPGPWPTVGGTERQKDDGKHFCLMPQEYMYDAALTSLKAMVTQDVGINDVIEIAIAGMHDGLGLNRVVFALLTQDKTKLDGRYMAGANNDPNFSQFSIQINIKKKDLFTQLMQKPRSVWVNDENNEKIWPLVPEAFRALIDIQEFYAMSVFAEGKPIGIFYADRQHKDIHLDINSYEKFKKLCSLVSRVIVAIRHT